jgi:hypothetical protein
MKPLEGNIPVLIFTKNLPTKVGFYWFTNFGEHTPVVLEVVRSNGKLWAQNEEFGFPIREESPQQELDLDTDYDLWKEHDGPDHYQYGDKLWCYIPNPWLPNMSKQVQPDCY